MPVAPHAPARPATGRTRVVRRRVIIGAGIVGIGVAPAPTNSKPERRTPTPAAMPVTPTPMRIRTAGHERDNTDDQRGACEKFRESRHRRTSDATPPLSIYISAGAFSIPTSNASAARSPDRSRGTPVQARRNTGALHSAPDRRGADKS